jgi:UDP-N-acetylmuramyl tripeptide synthase
LLLNADDAMLAARGAALGRAVTWFGLGAESDPAASTFIADDHFVALENGDRQAVLPVADFPLGMAGRARHNLANGVAAIALARALGLPLSACGEGLAGFESGPRDNPGRSNLFDIGGVNVLVDYAHNPHGVEAMLDTAQRLPAARRAVLLGQAGDRRDEDIRAMTRVVWRSRPDLIVVKEMESMLRGRSPGEVPRLITGELARLGVPREIVRQAPTELDAVRQAFDWARPGDLLLLLVHAQRAEVFDLIEGLRARERAG